MIEIIAFQNNCYCGKNSYRWFLWIRLSIDILEKQKSKGEFINVSLLYRETSSECEIKKLSYNIYNKTECTALAVLRCVGVGIPPLVRKKPDVSFWRRAYLNIITRFLYRQYGQLFIFHIEIYFWQLSYLAFWRRCTLATKFPLSFWLFLLFIMCFYIRILSWGIL